MMKMMEEELSQFEIPGRALITVWSMNSTLKQVVFTTKGGKVSLGAFPPEPLVCRIAQQARETEAQKTVKMKTFYHLINPQREVT